MIGSLAQPILFLVSLGYGFGPIFEKAGEGSYIQFLVPGIIGMGIIFTSVFSGIEIIWDRQFGFLKETIVAPVSRLNIMIGSTLGGATIATMQGMMIFLISLVAGFHPVNWMLVPAAILVMLLISLLFTAIGTAIASMLDDMQGFQLIINFLIMPLFYLSGSIFPLEGLPKVISTIAKFDPLSYGVDALRALLSNTSYFGLMTDVTIVGSLTVIFLVIGGYLFSKVQI